MVVVPDLTKFRVAPLNSSVPPLLVMAPVRTYVPTLNCRLPPVFTVHDPAQEEPQSPPPRKIMFPLLSDTLPVLLKMASMRLFPVPAVLISVPALLNVLPLPEMPILPLLLKSHVPLARLFTTAPSVSVGLKALVYAAVPGLLRVRPCRNGEPVKLIPPLAFVTAW